MRQGIDSVSPRIGPVILGKTLFESRRWIFRVGSKRLPIKQQRKGTTWENTVVVEIQLLRLNEVLLLDHIEFLPVKYNEREVGIGPGQIVPEAILKIASSGYSRAEGG